MPARNKCGAHKKPHRRSRKRIDREYYLRKKKRLWEEKYQNSIDKYVLGKPVTSSNIYSYEDYIGLVRSRILWFLSTCNKTSQHHLCQDSNPVVKQK